MKAGLIFFALFVAVVFLFLWIYVVIYFQRLQNKKGGNDAKPS